MKRLLLVAAVLGAVGLVGPRAEEKKEAKPKEEKEVVVPFELLKSGHMAVQVKVNGKGPYRLIFDTGAPITLLNNKVAKEAEVLKGMKAPAFTLFGNMGEAIVKELAVGEQAAADVKAIVMDHPTVEAISKALGPIEGIVGYAFFARYTTTIDYQAKTVTLKPNGFKPKGDMMDDLVKALMSGGSDPKILVPTTQLGLIIVKEAKDEDAGVTVKDVLADGPAAKAGVKTGDRLLTLDGRWTDSVADLYTAALVLKPGAAVSLVVKRDGKEVELKVKPTQGL